MHDEDAQVVAGESRMARRHFSPREWQEPSPAGGVIHHHVGPVQSNKLKRCVHVTPNGLRMLARGCLRIFGPDRQETVVRQFGKCPKKHGVHAKGAPIGIGCTVEPTTGRGFDDERRRLVSRTGRKVIGWVKAIQEDAIRAHALQHPFFVRRHPIHRQEIPLRSGHEISGSQELRTPRAGQHNRNQ